MSAAAKKEHLQHWDEKFRKKGGWGRYPPEDLVRYAGRTYLDADKTDISVLEVGCGPGANLWFLHREGYKISGIDGSQTAIDAAGKRLATENVGLNPNEPDLHVGDFSTLPWDDESFDLVVDIFAIYANTLETINQTAAEIHRVLKPGGRFYAKMWGRKTTGYGQGTEIEPGTYQEIPTGPCAGMGVSHFFDRAEIERIFSNFEIDAIDVLTRTDILRDYKAEEYMCQFTKR